MIFLKFKRYTEYKDNLSRPNPGMSSNIPELENETHCTLGNLSKLEFSLC